MSGQPLVREEVVDYLETVLARLEKVTDRLTAHEEAHPPLPSKEPGHEPAADA